MMVSRLVRLGLWPVIFTVLCVAIQGAVGGYATDRGLTNDEAAHLVNAMLVPAQAPTPEQRRALLAAVTPSH